MQNLFLFFFLGIILERKKFKTKTIQKQKVQIITFCCGDCRDKHGGGPDRAEGKAARGTQGFPKGSLQGRTIKKKGWLGGPNCSLPVKMEGNSGVFCSRELRKNKNKNNTCGLLKPRTISAKCAQEPQRF
jgi:hypothetical protein